MQDTVIERMRGTRIPEYYDGMYRDGYQPHEILEAARNSIIKEHEEREDNAPAEINITSEVHTV